MKEHAKRIHENPSRASKNAQSNNNPNQDLVYPEEVPVPNAGANPQPRLVINEDNKILIDEVSVANDNNNVEHNNNGSGDKFTPRVCIKSLIMKLFVFLSTN